jgi:hypothetical protein
VFNHDRGREERREIIVDSERDYYGQAWYDLDTRELTWIKEGCLSDPKNHSKSARASAATDDGHHVRLELAAASQASAWIHRRN